MHDAPTSEGDKETSSVDRMREHWSEFAREDAMHYIATNQESWESDEFYESGRSFADELLDFAGDGFGRVRALEVGCGAGRMLVHFADRFDRVDGIDIAPEMLEAARAASLPENVHLNLGSGASLDAFDDASFDFVYSVHVFQHVPVRSVVGTYIEETARVLAPGGRAVLHFDSRPNPPLRRLAMRLPDRLLPRDHRRYIRRYPVPREWPGAVATGAGLRVVDERSPGTAQHMALLERPS